MINLLLKIFSKKYGFLDKKINFIFEYINIITTSTFVFLKCTNSL